MKRVSVNAVGMALGIFLAAWHALWALLVWLGAAQPLMDFIFRLHMLVPPFTVSGFRWGSALSLVIVTGLIGYAGGLVLGWIWNLFVTESA